MDNDSLSASFETAGFAGLLGMKALVVAPLMVTAGKPARLCPSW
jgi:hypothetical protein